MSQTGQTHSKNLAAYAKPFKRQSYKMELFPTNCLSVFNHFVGLAPKGLKA